MPSLISKILHKKSSSSSVSPTSPTSPNISAPHKLHKPPIGGERSRHVSLPPTSRNDGGLPGQRRSLDGPALSPRSVESSGSSGSPVFHRRQGDGPALVSPTRAAPPPPLPTASPRSSLERDTTVRAVSLDNSRTPPSAYLHKSSNEPHTPGSPSSASSAVVTTIGPQGTHHDRHSSNSSLHLPSYSYQPGSSSNRTRRASQDESQNAAASPRSEAGSSPSLPPGAAIANPSMHYPQVAPTPMSPKSPLDRTQLLADTSKTNTTPTRSIKPVESFVDRPLVAEAPVRKSEEGEFGSLHSPALSSLDSRLLDQHLPSVPAIPAVPLDRHGLSDQSPYQPEMRAVHDHDGHRSPRRSGESRRSRSSVDIPERASSLSLLQPGGGGAMGSVSSFETFGMAGPGAATPRASRDKLDESSGNAELEQKLSALAIVPPHSYASLATNDNRQQAVISAADHETLEKARAGLVDRIVTDSQNRKTARGELSEEGREVFHRAGLAGGLDQSHNTVDVKTKWITPVVKEHIIRQEHTEYTTVIDREVHRHHVHPKIQPVEDPNPTILETRHRIFSSATGQWHEVIGDDKARAILGDDVFINGPRETRTKRTQTIPGFSPASPRTLSSTDVQNARAATGLDEFEDEDPTEAGFGTGGRGAVEREGLAGQTMSDWRAAERGGLFGSRESGDVVGTAW